VNVVMLRKGFAGRWLVLLPTVLHLSACALYGPDTMRASRLAYNDAV
jgi:hypothetical protein